MKPKRMEYTHCTTAILCATALLLALSNTPSAAQPAAEVVPSLERVIGARGAALGDAIGSDLYDIESMYSNPASLSFLRNPSVMLDHAHDWTNKVFIESAAGQVYESRVHTVGLGFGVEHNGPRADGSVLSFTEYDLDIGYSARILSLTPDVSLGVIGTFRFGKVGSTSLSGAQYSVGLMYSPNPGTSYSIVYHGIGRTIAYTAGSSAAGTTAGGVIVDPARSLEIGSTMRFPSTDRTPFLSISLAGEKLDLTRDIQIKGGLEAILWDFVDLRVGYINGRVKELRYGGGVSLGRFALDYAIMPWERSGRFDEITFKISI